MADGLSDALRQMADGEHAPPPRQPTAAPGKAAAVNDENQGDTGVATPSVRPRRAAPPQSAGARTLKLVAAALLLAMGLVMAAMGSWATMILAGHEVWRSHQPGVRSVALGLLVSYPIAVCLLGAATVLMKRGLKR